MADNTLQVAQIIDKLYVKTVNGSQKWSPSLIGGRYQARFGDYTVEIRGSLSALSAATSNASSYEATIKITKLDGNVVAETGGGAIARSLSSLTGMSPALSQAAQSKLNQLYGLLADRSDDLDELLNLI